MKNKYDEHVIITQEAIEASKQEMKANKKYSDEKMKNFTEEFKSMLVAITDQINNFKSLSTHKDSH